MRPPTDRVTSVSASQERVPRTVAVPCCPICGACDASERVRARDVLLGVPGEYVYQECRRCRTVFQAPRVADADLPLCYPSNYYTHAPPAPPPAGRFFSALRETLRGSTAAAAEGRPTHGLAGWIGRGLARSRKLRHRALFLDVARDIPLPGATGMHALDIGCGAGDLLLGLARDGWTCEGVEWDASAAEVARRRTGRPIHVGDFQKIDLPREAYALIVMKHVFEHLADPNAALRHLESLLAPSGIAVLIYPNAASAAARWFGNDWRGWEPPRHLVFPSRRGMAEAAAAAGLRVASIRSSARHTPGIIANSVALRDRGTESPRPPALVQQSAGFVAALASRLGTDAGDEAVVVLQKPGAAREGA